MFGSLGGGELMLILILALLLFGPRKLPGIGRTLGKAVQEFRGAANEFRRGVEREVHMEELREARDGLTEVGRDLKSDLQQVARDPGTRPAADPAPEGSDEGADAARRKA